MSRNNLRALVGNAHDRVVSNWGYNSAGIKTIQPGVIDLNNITSGTATITAVNLANAFLVMIGSPVCLGTDQPRFQFCDLQLTNSTTVTSTRNTSTADQCLVRFLVIEFQPGIIKSLQFGTATWAAPATTITAVNTAKAFVFHLGQTTLSPAAPAYAYLSTFVLTNATTVTVSATTLINPSTHRFVVVEFY